MQPHIFIRFKKQFVKINLAEIVCIESKGGEVSITCTEGKYEAVLSIPELEELLPAASFCKVSNACIVAMQQVFSYDYEHIFLYNGKTVVFENEYRKEFESKNQVCTPEFF